MSTDRFPEALARLGDADQPPAALHAPFLDVFRVDGASIATLGSLLGTETVAASDNQAARVDELQFDLGEGPCWDALAWGRPALEPDIARHPNGSWPAFHEAITREAVGAIFAFPLAIGPLNIGAVDLYSVQPCELDELEIRRGEAMARVVSRRVFRSVLDSVGVEYREEETNPRSRRIIHQATGIVLAQMQLTPADALLVIEGHAFAASSTVNDVAQRIVDGLLDLSTLGADDRE